MNGKLIKGKAMKTGNASYKKNEKKQNNIINNVDSFTKNNGQISNSILTYTDSMNINGSTPQSKKIHGAFSGSINSNLKDNIEDIELKLPHISYNNLDNSNNNISINEKENLKIENEYLSKIKTLTIKNNNLEKYKKENENKISELKKDTKIMNINGYIKDSELKRINNSIDINAKLLNKSINLLINNKSIFNNFKKEFKKMEIIQENINLSLTPDTYEKTIKRSKEQMNKILFF